MDRPVLSRRDAAEAAKAAMFVARRVAHDRDPSRHYGVCVQLDGEVYDDCDDHEERIRIDLPTRLLDRGDGRAFREFVIQAVSAVVARDWPTFWSRAYYGQP